MNEIARCSWCLSSDLYKKYHDEEWGVPVYEDQKLFELIIPIATFLTGTLSGIMLAGNDKDAQKMALQAATRPTTVSPAPVSAPSIASSSSANMPYKVPEPAATTPVPQAPVVTGFGGKPAPVQPPQNEL
jgi:hypothetical protein